MNKSLFYTVFFILFFVGCNDPKEANKSNFEEVINKYLVEKKENIVCRYIGDKFPIEDQFGIIGQKFDKYVSYDLLTKEISKKMIKNLLTGKDIEYIKNIYSLTELGEKHIINGKFCFGTPVVYKIINFTEPMVLGGIKITEVNYTYTLKDLPKWYKTGKNS